jgi:LuxR family transcriptional regulator, maltose regulon positive regulatory protein
MRLEPAGAGRAPKFRPSGRHRAIGQLRDFGVRHPFALCDDADMLGAGAAGPAAHSGVVARTSLFVRLSAAVDSGVTLISAPAGSGKTVLLRSWMMATDAGARTAWVSVDSDEHDAQRFWLEVVEALRSIPHAAALVDRRTATPEFYGPAFVDRLIDELRELDHPVVLVIDDLHELVSVEARNQLERFLARRPRQLSIVLATRHDPQLGLHRLRLSGELTEIRAADLRFSTEEAMELLVASGITLSDDAVARLNARTEGWAAGLRMAALALAGDPDPLQFVAEFSGSDRTVAEYLVAEVLDQQPEDVRTLLIETSILDRVSGPLADRLLGTTGSDRILLALEASNAFITALDAERQWFRYHQLFADLLRLELRRTSPERLPILHSTAADWYLEHGRVMDALRHRAVADDRVGTTRLLAEQGFGLVLDGHGPLIDRLLVTFPPDRHGDAELLALLAYRELSERSLDAAVEHLALAERLAEGVPREGRDRVSLGLTLTRLALARRRGDLEAALREIGPFLEPVDANAAGGFAISADARMVALMNLGIVELWSARLAEAEQHLERALAMARELERPFVEISCLSHLSLIISTRSFVPARARAEEALRLADAHGWAADPVAGTALASLASMDAAQGRFEDARGRLGRAAPLLRAEIEPSGALFVQFVWGDLLSGESRLAEAIDAYLAAGRLQRALTTRHILTGPVRESIALLQLRGGDVDAARTTLAALDDDDRRTAEARLAMAALRIADGAPTDAIETLDAVLTGDVPVLRVGTMIQALVVAATAHDRVGDRGQAEDLVERALELAEPDGLVLPFLVTPAPEPVELLERHPRHRTAHAGLLSDLIGVLRGSAPAVRASRSQALAEELSRGELRVLRYLPSNLTAGEIATELYLSTSTVKTHMRHVYEKLGAHRRTEAVQRARALGLLGPSAPRRG